MDNVIQLKPEEPMAWVCACKCMTFWLMSDGSISCAGCQAPVDGAGEWWVPPSDHSNVTDETPESMIKMDDDFLRERMARRMREDVLTLGMTITDEGSVTTWTKGGEWSDGQVDWLQSRLDDARKGLDRLRPPA